jgi:hypothetical protein
MIGNFFASGDTDVETRGALEVGSFTGPEGEIFVLFLPGGESVSVSDIDLVAGPGGRIQIKEAQGLASLFALATLAAALSGRFPTDSPT